MADTVVPAPAVFGACVLTDPTWRGDVTTSSGSPEDEPLGLQALMSAMTDPTVLLAPVVEDGLVVDFVFTATNPAFDEFLGTPGGASVGQRLSSAQDGADTQWILPRYVEVLVTGEPLVLDNVPRVAPGRGVLRHYDLRASRVGQLVGVTFRDVTSYVEATARLEESEVLFRTAMEASSRRDRTSPAPSA